MLLFKVTYLGLFASVSIAVFEYAMPLDQEELMVVVSFVKWLEESVDGSLV